MVRLLKKHIPRISLSSSNVCLARQKSCGYGKNTRKKKKILCAIGILLFVLLFVTDVIASLTPIQTTAEQNITLALTKS